MHHMLASMDGSSKVYCTGTEGGTVVVINLLFIVFFRIAYGSLSERFKTCETILYPSARFYGLLQ